ncbi:Deaminated glutathione amidase [uncultured Gammaproteobacteria bacterium]
METWTTGRLRVACVQVNAGPEIEPNLKQVEKLIRKARDAGAELIATPENVATVVQGRQKILDRVKPEKDNPTLAFFCNLAKETEAWLLVGSLGVLLGFGKVANRSYLIDSGGRVAAWYDKIHMFDVDLPDGESYRESTTFQPGDRAVVSASPWGIVGLTICYDLRFSYLFRALAKAGAGLITVPAAFTAPTGRAHWHVLLRARAIETGSFIVAPAQCGVHDEGRRTFGHSLIIDPWGEVLADGGDQPGVITAEVDLTRVAEVRSMIPALKHDRNFSGPDYRV